MKPYRFYSASAILLFVTAGASGQSGSPQTGARHIVAPAHTFTKFEPLNHWRADVLAGDKTALAAIYSTSPPARTQTQQGTSEDPGEEPEFWSALAARGLKALNPKVLEIDKSQPGMVSLVLRIMVALEDKGARQEDVVSAAQIWAQQGGTWRIVATRRSELTPNTPRRLPEPAVPNTDLYPPPEEAQAEVNAALAAAAKDHKRVILVFGANWCYDCHVLDQTFHSKQIAPLVEANYHMVHISIGDEDKNLDLARKYEVPLDKGVPALAILDPDGKLVFSQKQGEFESSIRIGPEDVVQFLQKWKPVRGN
jgi:thiol-disulfide isomerase/thioredoxin